MQLFTLHQKGLKTYSRPELLLGSGNTGRKPDTNNQNLVFRVLFPREYVKYTELGEGRRQNGQGRLYERCTMGVPSCSG